MVTEVAFDEDQVRMELPPDATAVGFAEICIVGGTWLTVTVAVAVAVAPSAPLAVMVNVVVCAGVTALWPFTGRELASTVGSAGEKLTDVALVVVHFSVLNCPAVIVVGDAASVAVTLPGGGGGGVVVPPTLPHPATAMVNNSTQIKLQTETVEDWALDIVDFLKYWTRRAAQELAG